MSRLIGEHLAATLGQPVVVQNRPGAVGTIGLAAVARANPDGYTLAMMALPYVVARHLIANISFDTSRDFAAVALVCWNYSVLAVSATSRLNSVDDLVKAAKATPGHLKYSSNGNGTPPHLAAELLERESGLDILHIPYKGSAPAISALPGDRRHDIQRRRRRGCADRGGQIASPCHSRPPFGLWHIPTSRR